jgi:hypothetical protein
MTRLNPGAAIGDPALLEGADNLARRCSLLQMREGEASAMRASFALVQVAQPRPEAETEQRAEGEDVIGSAAGVRLMRIDPQQRAMVQ